MSGFQPNDKDIAAIERIAERFDILDEMTAATKAGDVRAMIVVGPPGVGKTFGVQRVLEEQSLFDTMKGNPKYEIVKGATTALGLYAKLFNMSDKGSVLVFDDCDSILLDELSLNILKAALDTGTKRTIHWNADSRLLQREGIPNKFEFKGSVIFITNIKFDHVRSKKLQDHLSALESRCHYIDLTLNTERDKFLRIKQIAESGALFKGRDLEPEQEAEIINFMWDNQKHLREMSLRMAVKIADLIKTSPNRWRRIAEVTLMRNQRT